MHNKCQKMYAIETTPNILPRIFLILTSFRTFRRLRFTAWNIVLTNDIFYPKLLSFFLLSRSEYLGTWKRTHFVVIGKLLEEMLQGRMEFSKYKKSLTASKVRESKIRTNMIWVGVLKNSFMGQLHLACHGVLTDKKNKRREDEENHVSSILSADEIKMWSLFCMNLTIFVWNKSNSFSL